jgi:UDP-GlcNAc:undecaprenyl-phosphate GlcNAc-1-phosphate transferase
MIYFIFLNLFFLFFFSRLKSIYGIFDHSNEERKIHKGKISVIGGFFLFLNLILLSFFYIAEEILNIKIIDITSLFESPRESFSFFFTSFLIFIFGYFDDRCMIKPYKKLFLLSIATLTFILINKYSLIKSLNFLFLDTPLQLKDYSFLFTFLCIIILINAINMFDGVNLQISLYSIFIFVVFYIKSNNNFFLILIFFLVIFLLLNAQNKAFMGDSGSLLLGFIFSFFFINFYNEEKLIVEEIILLSFLPIIEFLRIFIYRIYSRRNPFKADSIHLHHFLFANFNFKSLIIISLFLFSFPYFFYILGLDFIFITIFFIIIYFYLLSFLKKNNINK